MATNGMFEVHERRPALRIGLADLRILARHARQGDYPEGPEEQQAAEHTDMARCAPAQIANAHSIRCRTTRKIPRAASLQASAHLPATIVGSYEYRQSDNGHGRHCGGLASSI